MSAGEGKIRILFAIPRFSVGGAEKLLVHQLSALNKERFTPSLITLFDEQKDTFADRVHIDECFQFRFVLDVRAFLKLYRYLRREKFDVVVTSLFSANLLVRIAAVFAKVLTIISYEHNIYPNKRAWQILIDRLLARKTACIITDSESARLFTAEQEEIPLDKFVTLYIPPLFERRPLKNSLELKRELGIADGNKIILTVSRLVSDKGHAYLIDAAKQVLARFPDAYFLIVGWGPLEGNLRAQAKKLGIASNIILPGRLDIQDVLPIADVYADPSVSTDLPIAVMEAMQEGKAIVATRVGDIPVFIENGVTGLIAEPRDSLTLADNIGTLLADPALRGRLGNEAKARVEKYSLPEYMKSFEALVIGLYDAHPVRNRTQTINVDSLSRNIHI